MVLVTSDIKWRGAVQIASRMIPDISNQAIEVEKGKMRAWIPPRDQDLIRRLILVYVVDSRHALPHAIANLGQVAALVGPIMVRADAAVFRRRVQRS